MPYGDIGKRPWIKKRNLRLCSLIAKTTLVLVSLLSFKMCRVGYIQHAFDVALSRFWRMIYHICINLEIISSKSPDTTLSRWSYPGTQEIHFFPKWTEHQFRVLSSRYNAVAYEILMSSRVPPSKQNELQCDYSTFVWTKYLAVYMLHSEL